MIILIHSSKTIRTTSRDGNSLVSTNLLSNSHELIKIIRALPTEKLTKMMQISPKLAEITSELLANWNDEPGKQRATIDSFLGDIYSGLQVQTWSQKDREYANQHLRILSGLYGILKPFDGIYPYRFEMGYKLPGEKNMYDFWDEDIAATLPKDGLIVNLAAVEYSKTVTDYVDKNRVITPRFLTISPKTGEPVFVVVHAKIARGAFARWMIQNKIEDGEALKNFNDIGYKYDPKLSSDSVPVFVCKKFGGLGLSVRLS